MNDTNYFNKSSIKNRLQNLYNKNKHQDFFLHREAAATITSKLENIKTNFKNTMIHGSWNIDLPKADKIIVSDLINKPDTKNFLLYDEENNILEADSHDLIISNLSLHFVSNLAQALNKYKLALKPSGLFIASLIGENSLQDLRHAMIELDHKLWGIAYPRLMPMIELRSLGDLMKKIGFDMPVIDIETIEVEYDSVYSLVRDLKQIGLSYRISNNIKFNKHYFSLLEEQYHNKEKNKVIARFEILYASGSKS